MESPSTSSKLDKFGRGGEVGWGCYIARMVRVVRFMSLLLFIANYHPALGAH